MRKDEIRIGEHYAARPDIWAHVRWKCLDISIDNSTKNEGSLVMAKVDHRTGELVRGAASTVRMRGGDLLCMWSGYADRWEKEENERIARRQAMVALGKALTSCNISKVKLGHERPSTVTLMMDVATAHKLVALLNGEK